MPGFEYPDCQEDQSEDYEDLCVAINGAEAFTPASVVSFSGLCHSLHFFVAFPIILFFDLF